jgi:hypothetical protein
MSSWYSWAFDGVAGAALVALCGFLYQRHSSRPGNVSPLTSGKDSPVASGAPVSASVAGPISESQVALGSNISQSLLIHNHYEAKESQRPLTTTAPSPAQIRDAIGQTRPFDRDRVCDNYTGLAVVWKIYFEAISRNSDLYQIFGRPGPNESPLVWFELTSIPPELKVADENAVLWVSGRIRRASADIRLERDPAILRIEHDQDSERPPQA